ncbi:MAG: diguanylate cyclase [Thermodesulfovibrionales bacterium]|nr:diguanylate cyclase [Thermodesulfovibrionales bacterium]
MNKILIVDDDKTTCRIILRVLSKKVGIDADVCYSFSDANTILQTNASQYCLAISDYNLPDAPNGEVVDLIISKKIPVIVLTASYDTDIRDKMLSKEIVDYIVKRSTKDLDYLHSIVQRAFKNRDIKVLVVDDSSVQRDTMARMLTQQLYKVLTAKSGKEAISIINNNPDIKLMITDYYMPDVDGFELVNTIRHTFKKDSMAIIVASGYGGTDSIPKFLKAGANDYIQKPFSREEFICRVNMNIETIEMIQTLKDFANKDPLTGIYNRRYFFETGKVVHATAKRNNVKLVAFMFDIDKFKQINDTYGHEGGDTVLKHFANLLLSLFKRQTDIVARLGGEEFCVLTSSDNAENLSRFAEHVRHTIENSPVSYGNNEIRYTSSIGIAYGQTEKLEELIKISDEKLYEAKNTGRNKVCMTLI